uniref:BEN domain-containing protein n=1 Tax=Trichogramma kaykai TaxID=54128 RepID=A0ABD2WAJ7_9HYME
MNKDTAKLVKGDLTAEAEATKTVINSEDVDKVQPLEFIDDMNKKLESSTILEENDSIKPAKRAGSMIDGESSNAKIPKFLHSTKVGIVHTSEIPTNKSMESITSTKIDSDLKINELHDAVKVNKKESSEKKIKELTIKLSKALKDAKKFESKWKDEKNNNLEYRETIRKKNDELKSVRDLNHQWQFKVLEKVDDYAKAEVNPFTSIIKSDASIGTLRLSNRTGDERPVMMMHCGNNIWIEEVAYHNAKNKGANAKNTFSQFVKEIACSIIGIEGLTEATPTGIFKHYLAKEKNMDPIQAAAELKKVHSYLSQKNHDLNSKKIAKNGPNSDKKKKTRVNKRSKKMQKDKEESESEEEDGSDEMNEFKENSKKKDGNNTNEESEDTGQKNKDKDKDSSSSSSSSEAESRDSDMDIE